MKNITKYFLLVIFCYGGYAQNDKRVSRVIYNIGIYNNTDLSTISTSKATAKFLDNVNKIQFELRINNDCSLYQLVDKIEESTNIDYKIAVLINKGLTVYYKNLKKKEKLYQIELQGQKFLINQPFIQYDWAITTENKFISGYKCYKATTTIIKEDYARGTVRNLNPIVWFTPEIPLSFGPNGLDGLPGLILEATIDAATHIYCSKIIFDSIELSSKIEKPSAGEIISEEEFQKINAKLYNAIQPKKL